MATSVKGIYNGFKYICRIFIVKEPEMEIGLPTDVKHVAHIGWDGPSGSAPTWMNEFKASSDFTATSIGNIVDTIDHSSSTMSASSSQVCESKEVPSAADFPDVPKKHKRKKKSFSFSSLRCLEQQIEV